MLYQQGTQRIEVIVKKDSSQMGVAEKDAGKSTEEIADKNAKKGGLSAKNKRMIITNVTHALSTAKQVMDLGIQYYISGIGVRNGDQAMQDQVSRTMEKIEDTTNFASNVSRGAIFGAWAGPVGIAVGMMTAAASSGASLAVKYAGRERDYNYKVFKENNAIEYNRTRAGVNMLNGRLR